MGKAGSFPRRHCVQNIELSRARWIPGASIGNVITRIATFMSIALTTRLSTLWDLCALYHAIRNYQPIIRPSSSKTANRIYLGGRGRDARVTKIRRDLCYTRGRNGTKSSCAHAAWRQSESARPA